MLSHRLARSNEISLEGIFDVLENMARANLGPVAVDELAEVQLHARAAYTDLQVLDVDKFPWVIDYAVPSGVCIADDNNVHLGAHLAEGTAVMHVGLANSNVGTLGSTMVEGRTSQGAIIGISSDIGGDTSMVGMFSGGNKEGARAGERSLVDANTGVGIALGDDCTVEVSLYVTAGTKVTVLLAKGENDEPCATSARELSGVNSVLFRRNLVISAVKAVPHTDTGIKLNSTPHAN